MSLVSFMLDCFKSSKVLSNNLNVNKFNKRSKVARNAHRAGVFEANDLAQM